MRLPLGLGRRRVARYRGDSRAFDHMRGNARGIDPLSWVRARMANFSAALLAVAGGTDRIADHRGVLRTQIEWRSCTPSLLLASELDIAGSYFGRESWSLPRR